MLLSTADHPDRLKAKFRAALGRAQMLGFPSVDIGSVPFEAIAEKMIKPVEQGNALRKKEPEFYPAEFTLFGGVDGDLFEAELRCEVNGAFVVLESQTEDESLPQRQVTVEMPEGMPVTVDSIRSAMDRAGVPVADRPSEDAIREAILMAAAAARQELQAEGESSP